MFCVAFATQSAMLACTPSGGTIAGIALKEQGACRQCMCILVIKPPSETEKVSADSWHT